MSPSLIALIVSGTIFMAFAVFSNRFAKRMSRRARVFLAFIVSAYFGAFLFASVSRMLGWASLKGTNEIVAFAAGIIVVALAAGWTGVRLSCLRAPEKNT